MPDPNTAPPSPNDRRDLVPVALPLWDCTLYVRRLSAAEVLDLASAQNSKDFTTQLLARAVCFADGGQVWSDETASQILDYPMPDIQPLFDAAMRHNELDRPAEERMGNSAGGPSVSSSSASPGGSVG